MILNQNLKVFYFVWMIAILATSQNWPKKKPTCFHKRGDESRWNVVFGFLKNEGYEFYFYFILIFGFALFCWKLFQRDGGGTNKA